LELHGKSEMPFDWSTSDSYQKLTNLLRIAVKVNKDWRKKEDQLKEFGYLKR
jgi:hypothetical protein